MKGLPIILKQKIYIIYKCNVSYAYMYIYHPTIAVFKSSIPYHGPLARYAKSRVRMRRECRERFPRHRR